MHPFLHLVITSSLNIRGITYGPCRENFLKLFPSKTTRQIENDSIQKVILEVTLYQDCSELHMIISDKIMVFLSTFGRRLCPVALTLLVLFL